MKYVLIGGVAGGATTAARLRRLDEKAEIVLIERGDYISYANCGLPYYIGGVIAQRDQLFVQTPDRLRAFFNIDVRIRTEAIRIDRSCQEVVVRSADGNVESIHYDKLLLSTGARAIKPRLEGIDHERIVTLRNVPDTDTIKRLVTEHPIRKVTIIGAGFIGLEMAENLHRLGIEVSIVEMAPQVMAPLDFPMAALVGHHLVSKGVHLYLGEEVTGFAALSNSEGVAVALKSGMQIESDMVLLSIGVQPESSLAEAAGLDLGARRGIIVNPYLQTSDPLIYAIGDVVEYLHPLLGEPWHNFLAGPANRQGRLAADNMALGNVATYEGSIWTGIAQVFDLTVGATGVASKRLQQLNIPHRTTITHSASHASYYPGAEVVSTELIFSPMDGKLLGAQVVGAGGVDKRIDQLALLIKLGASVADLVRLEHAYAPPFSSAKDPIAIAGYVAQNLLEGRLEIIDWHTLQNEDLQKVQIVDVRSREEYLSGHIPHSISLPLTELREQYSQLDRERPIVLACAIGQRSWYAYRLLKGLGYNHVAVLSGGVKTYLAATTPCGASPKV